MGEVWLGEGEHGVQVALETLRPELTQEVARFARERREAAR
jgi:hypothetical protein